MTTTDTDRVEVRLIGGPLHNLDIEVARETVRYKAPISGLEHTSAVYASNGADTAEFLFAGYTG